MSCSLCVLIFGFTTTSPTEIYTLSLHDALPILTNVPLWIYHKDVGTGIELYPRKPNTPTTNSGVAFSQDGRTRSEEHTSGLQSRRDLVCRLLLEKKKNNRASPGTYYAPVAGSSN